MSVAGQIVQTARFTKDTQYLAVGLDNGTVLFLTGKPPYSNTPLWTIDVESSKTIVDIGFNSNNMKMVVCFSNSAGQDIYLVHDYAGTPSLDSTSLNNHAQGCKLSESDEVVVIDQNKRAYIYDTDGSGNIVTPASTLFQEGNKFMDLDVRPTTAAPSKVVVANENDDIGGHFFDGDSSYTQNTFTSAPSNQMLAACFSPQADFYAFGGKDQIVPNAPDCAATSRTRLTIPPTAETFFTTPLSFRSVAARSPREQTTTSTPASRSNSTNGPS